MTTRLPTPGSLTFRNGIDFDSRASVGARSGQEDYAFFGAAPSSSELLAVLADGMGGHSAGEVASKRAVDAFQSTFRSYPSGAVAAKLGAALNQANSDLAACVKDSPMLSGMGCTLVGAHFSDQGLHWISVGDSPLFLFRNGSIKRLNADHSMAPVIEESRRQGRITDAEALSHPDRHALRSALTGSDLAMIDSSNYPQALKKGDVIVLASDGLLTLSEAEISKIIKGLVGENAQVLVTALMKAVEAKKKPRQDNTTVQVIIAPRSMGVSWSLPTAIWWLPACALIGTLIGWLLFSDSISVRLPSLSGLSAKTTAPTSPSPVPVPVDELPKSEAPVAVDNAPAPATLPSAPVGKPKGKSKPAVSGTLPKAKAPDIPETTPKPAVAAPLSAQPASEASEKPVQAAPVASTPPVGSNRPQAEKDPPAKPPEPSNNALPSSPTPASNAPAITLVPAANDLSSK